MEEFLRACGARGPLAFKIENRGLSAVRWSANQPFALIGRDPAADITLDHPRIDGHHTFLQMIDGEVFWVDLESHTGTRKEDGTARSGWLTYPHGIAIGPYVIQLAQDPFPERTSTPAWRSRPDPFSSQPRDAEHLPHVILEFRRHDATPVRWRMRHILTLLGSSPHCKVRLATPGVLPFHCSLLRTSDGVWAVDLLGHGGTLVNGMPIRAQRLGDGDSVQLGDVQIRVFLKRMIEEPRALKGLNGKDLQDRRLSLQPQAPSRELVANRPEGVWLTPHRENGKPVHAQVSSEAEFSPSLISSLLDQFGHMQQEFVEQFQQTTVMMFRALQSLHQDQMKELKERIESLNAVTANLQVVQSRIENGVAPAISRQLQDHLPPPVPITDAQVRTRVEEGKVSGSASRSDDAALSSPQSAENNADDLRHRIRSIVDHSNNISTDVHEWLIARIAAIENEQRTRWQKIVDMVRGK